MRSYLQTRDWNRIPANIVDVTKVKEIISVGSHQMNRVFLAGDHVSRFHATMKRMADGKWYIQDHSKNGTTINGTRIPKDQDVRIKRGDKISCAGVPVKNPINIRHRLTNNFFIYLVFSVATSTYVAIKIKRAWCRMPHSKSKVLGKPNARI